MLIIFILAIIKEKSGRNLGSFTKFYIREKMALFWPFWRFFKANVALCHSETMGPLMRLPPACPRTQNPGEGYS